MKHNLKQLDQFFDAARSEKPVLDDDAFASIIAKADVPTAASSKTELMTNSPISRILTALRQQHGGMIMTGLGLTALTGLLVTGYYLSDSDPVAQTQALKQVAEQASVATLAAATTEPTAPTVESKPAAELPADHFSLVNPTIVENRDPKQYSFRDPLSIDSLWSAVEVETVKPIEATPAEIIELGINDAGDGKVYVIHELNKGSVRMKMSFPPTGMDAAYDLRVGDGPAKVYPLASSIESSDRAVGMIAPIMPTMVTDAKGKKLAFFFKSAHSDNSVNIQSATFSQREGFDGESDSDRPNLSMNVTIAESNGEILTEDIHGLPDPEMMREMEFDMQDADFDFDSLMMQTGPMMKVFSSDSNYVRQFGPDNFDFTFDFSELTNNSAAAKMMIKFGEDTSNFNFKFSMDSNMLNLDADAMSKAGIKLERHAVALQLNADSLRATIMKELGNLNLDSIRGGMKLLRNELRNLRIDSARGIRSLKQLRKRELRQERGTTPMLTPPRIRELNMPMRVEVEMINNLVPVQIKQIDPSVKHNQNGLIFWYSRDKKFEEKAPAMLVEKVDNVINPIKDDSKQLASISKTSAVSDQMIYPNPTPGRAIFKYTLTEPRQVSMAIHDLLGKQLLKISDLEAKSSGTFEKELDLSSLESGVYLLVMITDSGEQITQRIVVEK